MQRITAQKNYTLSEADRLQLATLLIKAGYTVKLTREKPTGKNTFSYYVDYAAKEDLR